MNDFKCFVPCLNNQCSVKLWRDVNEVQWFMMFLFVPEKILFQESVWAVISSQASVERLKMTISRPYLSSGRWAITWAFSSPTAWGRSDLPFALPIRYLPDSCISLVILFIIIWLSISHYNIFSYSFFFFFNFAVSHGHWNIKETHGN